MSGYTHGVQSSHWGCQIPDYLAGSVCECIEIVAGLCGQLVVARLTEVDLSPIHDAGHRPSGHTDTPFDSAVTPAKIFLRHDGLHGSLVLLIIWAEYRFAVCGER